MLHRLCESFVVAVQQLFTGGVHLLSCAQAFRGIWRMQPGNPGSTILYYSLYVQPQAWLPVKLIQNRIEREVVKNLAAVAIYSEQQHQLTGARTA